MWERGGVLRWERGVLRWERGVWRWRERCLINMETAFIASSVSDMETG